MTDPTTTGTAGTPAPTPVVDPVVVRLTELGVTNAVIETLKTTLGVTTVEDLATLNESDLLDAGMKKVPARKLLASLKPATPPATATAFNPTALDDVLPSVPSDESWLSALKIGGVLKVEQSTVIAAVRATLANRVGLFNILDRVVELIEDFADKNEEQVDADFYKLRKQMMQRNYAEIFSAIDGLDGKFVTDTRKKELFKRIDTYLWPAITAFYGQLKAWQESWMQGAANPAMMMAAFMGASAGGTGMLPPGMMQPPDTGTLRDYAEAVANAINKVFAGTGVQIASAIAYDASRIKDTLSNPRLPAMIGATNRDQMLKMLGANVPATYPRLEVNLTKFVLSVLQAKDQPAGNDELRYFSYLCMLGAQIPWDSLGENMNAAPKLSGIGSGGKRPRNGLLGDVDER